MRVTRTERGWPAHFCAVSNCTFRRNTLLVSGSRRVVVSTVGNYRPKNANGEAEEIGVDRHYETMAFRAKYEAPYWEADIGREITIRGKRALKGVEFGSDKAANDMHEAAVAEIADKLERYVEL